MRTAVSVTFVVKERVATEVRYIEVYVSVVIDVRRGHAHPPTRVIDARRRRNVGELPCPVVSIESVTRWLAGFLRAGQRGSVDEIDVVVAVSVVVEETSARADGFDHVLLFSRGVVVDEVDSALLRHIDEEISVGGDPGEE